MRADLPSPLQVGDRVTLSQGLYAGIDGEVIDIIHTVRPWMGRARLRLPCLHGEYWHPYWSDTMDEAEWLASDDTAGMERYLQQLDPPGALRKWRLFAAACVRRIWDHLPDARSRRMIVVSERYADGRATLDDLKRVAESDAAMLHHLDTDWLARMPTQIPSALPRFACLMSAPIHRIRWLAVVLTGRFAEEGRGQRELLRDLFGNPFRPAVIDPAWLAWDNGVVGRLARDIYDSRRFDEMPVLADALEDAGCTDAELFAHLRSPGPHARGCWALDALLER